MCSNGKNLAGCYTTCLRLWIIKLYYNSCTVLLVLLEKACVIGNKNGKNITLHGALRWVIGREAKLLKEGNCGTKLK